MVGLAHGPRKDDTIREGSIFHPFCHFMLPPLAAWASTVRPPHEEGYCHG